VVIGTSMWGGKSIMAPIPEAVPGPAIWWRRATGAGRFGNQFSPTAPTGG